MTERERFWSFVDRRPEGCWVWTGAHARGRWPYGTFRCGLQRRGDHTQMPAHRYAFAERVGLMPPGRFVCHRCDNPPCVNPDHLFIGTPKDNIRDMWAKGRARPTAPRGRHHHAAKLTPDIAAAVRMRRARGEQYRAIAPHFGISFALVARIIRRQTFLDR